MSADDRRGLAVTAGVGRRPLAGPPPLLLRGAIVIAARVQDQRQLVPQRVAGRWEVLVYLPGAGGQVADALLAGSLGRAGTG
jgi:hypothetical protein